MKNCTLRSPVLGRARTRLVLATAVGLALAAGAVVSRSPALEGAAPASAIRESQGYWLLGADGGVFAFGDATYYGPNRNVGADIAGMAHTPDGGGFWEVDDDGDVFHYGNAINYGSRLLDVDDITGFAARPRGDGYWMASRRGVVSAFGAAPNHGPTVPLELNRPIVDMAVTPSGLGYWLVASDGGIFSFGDAAFHGSTGAVALNKPIVGIASTPSGSGYWLVASDGGIFSFGDAAFHGSTGAVALNKPIVGMASTGTGLGYWLVASDGGVFSFGDAGFHGSTGAVKLNQPIMAMVASPVRVINAVPAAAPDSAAVDEDASVTVDVLANDSGLGDGGLAVSIASPPAHGSAGVEAGGSVSYTPSPDFSGPDALTYRVVDVDGEVSTATLNITVTPRNDAPTAADQSRSTSEDVVLTGSVGATDIDGDNLSYSVAVPAGHGTASVNAAGGFTYSPQLDFNGADSFTITISDGRGGFETAVVNVTVAALTDPPTISAIDNLSTLEDTPTAALAFTIGDVDTPLTSLTVGASSSNQAVVANSGIVLGGSDANRTVTVTPVADATGSATITVTVSDGGPDVTESFVLTVNTVSDPPTISAIADGDTDEDTPTAALAFTIGDVDTPLTSLTVGASSSDQTVVANSGIALGGIGANRSVTVTPVANASGQATITVTVSGGGPDVTETFVLTVNAVDDQPTISNIADLATPENTPTAALAFTIGDADTPLASLTVGASSSNQAVVANGSIALSGTGANRTVTVTPVGNASGTATITITVSGGGPDVTETFVLTVTGQPTISTIDDLATLEDTPTAALAFTIGDVDTPLTSLTVSASSSDQTVVANSGIALGGTGANRTVTVTPVGNASGSATITVTVSDGGPGVSETLVLTVNAVDDAPTITAIADQFTTMNIPTAALAFTMTDIDTAPESLVVIGMSSNQSVVADLGIVVVGTGFNRTVTVTPVTDFASGMATITLTVSGGGPDVTTAFVLTVST